MNYALQYNQSFFVNMILFTMEDYCYIFRKQLGHYERPYWSKIRLWVIVPVNS